MSVQSEAAKAHIEKLLEESKPSDATFWWYPEYRFALPRKWRFDYAVPSILCANPGNSLLIKLCHHRGVIELDGGTFVSNTGHCSGVGLRAWREKNNAAMSLGWRVWHYAPEEVIKAGRKTLPDEPILKKLPWL